MSRRGGQPAVGAAPQYQGNRMVFGSLIRNVVGSFDSRRTGMVVVKIPRRERAVGCEAALHLDDAGGTKIGPGKFFFARPNDFHGMPGRAGQASGLQRGVAGVLSAVRGTSVRHDHANAAFRNMEYGSQVVADSKEPLRSRPNRQFPASPFGNSGTRF